jgi:hypothetical protein
VTEAKESKSIISDLAHNSQHLLENRPPIVKLKTSVSCVLKRPILYLSRHDLIYSRDPGQWIDETATVLPSCDVGFDE